MRRKLVRIVAKTINNVNIEFVVLYFTKISQKLSFFLFAQMLQIISECLDSLSSSKCPLSVGLIQSWDIITIGLETPADLVVANWQEILNKWKILFQMVLFLFQRWQKAMLTALVMPDKSLDLFLTVTEKILSFKYIIINI